MTGPAAVHHPGRHLVQVPGPTNVPERVLRAIGQPTIDHRGPAFADLTTGLLTDVRSLFHTEGPVVMYPGSGTGAWEAALENTLSPGDGVLITETGQFAALWASMAGHLGLEVTVLPTDWRSPVDPKAIEEALAADSEHRIHAVLVTHNETSTGVISDVAAVRAAIDAANHPALLLVDAVSSLASVDYRQDEWGVDVTVAASQKGLMMPPGLCFNAVSERALAASKGAQLPKAFWAWEPILEQNARGYFPYTPATNMLFGLRAALDMIAEEGLSAIFARQLRFGEATRAAVGAWGLELQCRDPSAYSPTVSAVVMPESIREEAVRAVIHDRFAMSLGAGLGRLVGKAFRIGHLGDFDDLSLISVLAGVELGLDLAGVEHRPGGVQAAMAVLGAPESARPSERRGRSRGRARETDGGRGPLRRPHPQALFDRRQHVCDRADRRGLPAVHGRRHRRGTSCGAVRRSGAAEGSGDEPRGPDRRPRAHHRLLTAHDGHRFSRSTASRRSPGCNQASCRASSTAVPRATASCSGRTPRPPTGPPSAA